MYDMGYSRWQCCENDAIDAANGATAPTDGDSPSVSHQQRGSLSQARPN